MLYTKKRILSGRWDMKKIYILINSKKMATKSNTRPLLLQLRCQHKGSQTVPHAQLRAQFRTSCTKSLLFVQQSCISRANVSFSSQQRTLSRFKSRTLDQYRKNDSVSSAPAFSSPTADRLLFTSSPICSGANGSGLFLERGISNAVFEGGSSSLTLLLPGGRSGRDRVR
ncbi:hypothetical protein BDR22DRAFT_481314 [Usnea florida]